MSRTKRVDLDKIKIYPFRHSPFRDFRQAISRSEKDLEYIPRSRDRLNVVNLTSAWADIYKGVFDDKWGTRRR